MTAPGPRRLPWVAAAGGVLFVALFSAGYRGHFDFWIGIALVSSGAAAMAVLADPAYRDRLRPPGRGRFLTEAGVGLLSALVLFGIFAMGHRFVRAWLPGLAPGVDSVYALKEGVPPWRIALLIGLIVAPAEEIYWRGGLQHMAAIRLGRPAAMGLVALFYAAVHLPTGNAILAVAALVCGLFWGALYAWRRSLTANVVSHVAWDLAVFLVFPFTG